MASDNDDRVVQLVPRQPRTDWDRILLWECECKSRRFFLTPRGPECVYCAKIAEGYKP